MEHVAVTQKSNADRLAGEQSVSAIGPIVDPGRVSAERAMFDTSLLDPAPHNSAIARVLLAQHLELARLLERDDHPVHAGERQDQQDQRPDPPRPRATPGQTKMRAKYSGFRDQACAPPMTMRSEQSAELSMVCRTSKPPPAKHAKTTPAAPTTHPIQRTPSISVHSSRQGKNRLRALTRAFQNECGFWPIPLLALFSPRSKRATTTK